jgi:hypothetical protein
MYFSFFYQTKAKRGTWKMPSAVRYTFLTPHAHRRQCPRHCAVGTHNFGLVSRAIIDAWFSKQNANRGSAFAFVYILYYTFCCAWCMISCLDGRQPPLFSCCYRCSRFSSSQPFQCDLTEKWLRRTAWVRCETKRPRKHTKKYHKFLLIPPVNNIAE